MPQATIYNITINCDLGSSPPKWQDFKKTLFIEASFLRESEIISNLPGFAMDWEGTTKMVGLRSNVISGSDGSTPFGRNSNVASFSFVISKADFNSLLSDKYATVFVWAKPDGAVALSVKGKTSKFGLLKLRLDDKVSKSVSHFGYVKIETIEFDITLHKSIVSVTIDQILKYNHNNNSAIDDIKMDRTSTANLSDNILQYSLLTGYPKVSENANARFGTMSVPRNSGFVTRKALDATFNGQIKDISDDFWEKNRGALDLKPDLTDYGFFTTIGNTGVIYQADIFSNLSWGYTGDYIGYSADQMNDWARLDPSPMAPQDDISTIYGTKVNQNVSDPSLVNNNYRNDMFEYIINILRPLHNSAIPCAL